MKCFVLTGNDDWAMSRARTQLIDDAGLAPAQVEKFDLTVDGGDALVESAATFSLFGSARVLDASPASALTAENAAALVSRSTDVTVVLRGPSPASAAVRRNLESTASFQQFRVPSGAAVIRSISDLATDYGIRLPAEGRAALAAVGGNNLPRARSALGQLHALGMTEPGVQQIETLLGSATGAATPWELSDAIESRDIGRALDLSGRLEPTPTIAYLASHMAKLGRVLDGNFMRPEDAADALALPSAFAAQKLLTSATRLGSDRLRRALALTAAADRDVKLSSSPREILDVLVVKLCGLHYRDEASMTAGCSPERVIRQAASSSDTSQ